MLKITPVLDTLRHLSNYTVTKDRALSILLVRIMTRLKANTLSCLARNSINQIVV